MCLKLYRDGDKWKTESPSSVDYEPEQIKDMEDFYVLLTHEAQHENISHCATWEIPEVN